MDNNTNVVPTDILYTSTDVENIIRQLVDYYTGLDSGSIGESVLGRPIYYIKIGTGEKEVCYSAAIHANEWITTPVLLKFAEDCAKALESDGRIFGVQARRLFQTFTLYLIPLLNPDGVDLVNGAIEEERILEETATIAQEYPQIPYPEGWKANIEGIDLNLQFPAGWNQAKDNKYAQGFTTPAPRDYVGEIPLQAPESRALYEFTRNHNFLLILAYHTQGEVIYWKYLDYEPTASREIAEYFSAVSGYAIEETPQESGYAGYKDWFIQEYNRPGYTIEVGVGVNPLPVSQFSKIYHDNRLILLGGMTELW